MGETHHLRMRISVIHEYCADKISATVVLSILFLNMFVRSCSFASVFFRLCFRRVPLHLIGHLIYARVPCDVSCDVCDAKKKNKRLPFPPLPG